MSNHFIIGTRGSLLAKTQCTLFKNLLESKSDNTFELKFITTQGDQQTDKPLWQMEGQNFFTKELDRALLDNEVDLVVHSYKDLGSIRPEGTEIATISKRVFPEDIILIKKDHISSLSDKKEIIVGTSSPRRITNIENHLHDFIPCHEQAKIQCKTLRGNVNSRIQKLLDGHYDMIVLAMAGLERLAQFPDSNKVLKELVQDLDFMIMPQKSFPSAASQGALAVEVNVNSPRYQEIKEALSFGHDETSASAIRREREIFNQYGGGCHLAVGIHVKNHKDHQITIERGHFEDQDVHKISLNTQSELGRIKKFIGSDQELVKQIELDVKLDPNFQYFVTSRYCFHAIKEKPEALWVSGYKTHKDLAKKGYWINGSADGFGHEVIADYQKSELVRLFNKSELKTLSHDNAQSINGKVISCYKRETTHSYQLEDFNFDTCFWGSFAHYQAYTEKFPELLDKKHACGLGKTYDQFISHGINVIAISSMKEILD